MRGQEYDFPNVSLPSRSKEGKEDEGWLLQVVNLYTYLYKSNKDPVSSKSYVTEFIMLISLFGYL